MSEPIEIAELQKKEPGLCCAPEPVPMLAPDEADQVAGLLKALGHPVRLQMIHILSRLGGHVCVCDIEAHFDIKQPTVSHHLRKLKEAGLVDVEQRGLYAFYRVRPETIALLRRQLNTFAP